MTLIDGVYHLDKLKPLSENSVDHNCWRGLFNSVIVVDDDPQGLCRGLELDFNILIQLSAVEYPVEIETGLILMGYSTALIPVQETDDGMILWHLEIASHDYQFKVSDLKAIQGKWLQTQDLDYLQSKKALLGWCTQARILLGTSHLRPTVTWSGAEKKSTTWHWKSANLQLIAQTASPLQIGGQAGMTFDRTSNLLRFSPSRNYIKCVTGSMMEQIILYDVSTKRAWLVSLISVLHHMLLVYYRYIEKASRSKIPPGVVPLLGGASASLVALSEAGGVVIQGSNEDSLTIRELIMGFSVNLSRASVHKPKRSQIYGYEFMDIVMDSPRSELRKQTLEKEGLAWSPLLSEINCLFCSNLGEVMIGGRGLELLSLCNRLPDGYDFMAASMRSIEKLSKRYSHEEQSNAHRLSQDHFWRVSGDPFERCKHSALHQSCWYQPSFLQEINGPESRPRTSEQGLVDGLQSDHLDGALVFGEPIKSSRKQMAIRVSELYRAQKGSFVPVSAEEIHVERNTMFAHADSKIEMDS
ncbi:uncharacterized protein N7483_012096 [Penicillium malachiteum]|uniref:uncharacterized protein n=1 Tax=Penicillium malachiteum TaxID=1324776 RepID=UPI0025486D77|nr:uncharacterized protein N7483_012096 [Penicillium malachiteum]KAJ5714915.1 hypothetical protein N7483_012096 [Penicillium malachiteum]